MLWLIAPIVIVALAFARGFRKTALALFVAAVAASGFIYQRDQQAQQRATSRIAESEIQLANIDVRRTFDSSYELSGSVQNNSRYRLDGLTFNVKLRSCRGADAQACVPLAEETVNVAVTVPPQQARDFTGSLFIGKQQTQPKGNLAWDYRITAITAKRQ